MDTAAANVLCASAFVEELWRSGVHHACVCPGSRSTPLAVAFGRHAHMRTWVHLDERSAAYFALGLAKADSRPVVLLCTSGTAAANFLPAVVEASLAGVPLIVLTADRPPELHHVGANQTIDQIKLYGSHVRWAVQMPPPDASRDVVAYYRTIACRAVHEARADPPAPIHLNVPFREPFLPTGGDVADTAVPPEPARARDGAAPLVIPRPQGRKRDTILDGTMRDALTLARRGIIVCGPQPDVHAAESLRRLAAAAGYPILADPLSQVRSGEDYGAVVVDRYDAFLRDDRVVAALAPDVILRFGATPTSKPLLQYLQRHVTAFQVLVQHRAWNDPLLVSTNLVDTSLQSYVDSILPALERDGQVTNENVRLASEARRSWSERWRRINDLAGGAIDAAFDESSEIFEGRVFAELSKALAPGSTLFAGNSMPVRDADAFLPSNREPMRVLGNRGASGIDGVVSTALGVAAAGERVTLVIGDVSLYHDLNGLLAAKLYGLPLTVVLVNNDGGGIFSFLPQAESADRFERLFGTPHGLDFRHAVEMYGGAYVRAESWQHFRAAVETAQRSGGLRVIEIRTDRRRNVEQHRAIWRRVADAVARAEVAATGGIG